MGNYGVNNIYNESSKVYAKGLIVKSICHVPSNHLSEKNLDEFLKEKGVVGISGVDTRSITKKIRELGAMKCIISNENLPLYKIKEKMKSISNKDLVKEVSINCVRHIKGEELKVAILDFGIKKSIIKNLVERKCDITMFPYNSSYEEIMSINPNGILLSNGPGDPKELKESIEVVKKFIGKIPIFGICLGHQILTLSLGGDTYKMKFGHRGGNHGVYNIEKDKAYITSQNHGYAVKKESLDNLDLIITHVNLNDDTVEGIKHKKFPIFSVQFHPEGAPGPTDTSYLFDEFINNMLGDDTNAIE